MNIISEVYNSYQKNKTLFQDMLLQALVKKYGKTWQYIPICFFAKEVIGNNQVKLFAAAINDLEEELKNKGVIPLLVVDVLKEKLFYPDSNIINSQLLFEYIDAELSQVWEVYGAITDYSFNYIQKEVLNNLERYATEVQTLLKEIDSLNYGKASFSLIGDFKLCKCHLEFQDYKKYLFRIKNQSGYDGTFYVATFQFPKSASLDLELVKKIIMDKLILK